VKVCRVLGTVVATAHHPAYDGRKLLVVQPLDDAGAPAGASYLAVDVAQAGVGDTVLVSSEGNGTRQVLRMGDIVPVRSLIVGVIDRVDVEAAEAHAPATTTRS
jgi:ethanolamine utilization protein EutN